MLKIAVMTPRRAYRTDLSDARWALAEPILAAWRAARAEAGLGLSEPVHDLREIVNAILYVNRTGIAWEYLPHDFPPYKTVYDYYAKWQADGTTEAIHDMLRRKVRQQAGRAETPSAAIMDAQSIRTSGNVPESSQGIDAANHAGRAVMPGRAVWPGAAAGEWGGDREMPGITTGSQGRRAGRRRRGNGFCRLGMGLCVPGPSL